MSRGLALILLVGRPFGYFIGDEIALESEVRWDAGFTLTPASLPQPGPVTYWLDLKSVQVARIAAGHYRLRFLYQTFYSPLGAQSLEIPGYTLTASDGNQQREVSVPAWRFLMSPLRNFERAGRAEAVAIRADVGAVPMSLTPAVVAASSFGGMSLLAGLAAAWHWSRWPFGHRGSRPFTQVRRGLRDAGYPDSLLRLHRAFDASANTRLLFEDLEPFLARRPVFRPLRAEIAAFFGASRQAFFGNDPGGAMRAFPPVRLQALADRLAAAERAA